ncbi:unnamed protein product [Phaeothamnion confervicola]
MEKAALLMQQTAFRLAHALCLAHCAGRYVGGFVNCRGPSMHPTILDGSIIIQDKASLRWRGPCIGEVVVVRDKRDRRRHVLKRVTALEGETVVVRRPPAAATAAVGSSSGDNGATGESGIGSIGNEISGGSEGRGGSSASSGDNARAAGCQAIAGAEEAATPQYVAPEIVERTEVVSRGHVWVEGDNAAISVDSRTYGAVPQAMVVGRLCYILPPPLPPPPPRKAAER